MLVPRIKIINVTMVVFFLSSYFFTKIISATFPVHMLTALIVLGPIAYPLISVSLLGLLYLWVSSLKSLLWVKGTLACLFVANLIWFLLKWDLHNPISIAVFSWCAMFYATALIFIFKIKSKRDCHLNILIGNIFVLAICYFSFLHYGNL